MDNDNIDDYSLCLYCLVKDPDKCQHHLSDKQNEIPKKANLQIKTTMEKGEGGNLTKKFKWMRREGEIMFNPKLNKQTFSWTIHH